MRTAAVDAFLSELKARRSGDLNSVLVTLNDGSLCRQALEHWISHGWIVVAPFSPLVAMAGPEFTHDLTLRRFCGEPREEEEPKPSAAEPLRSDSERTTNEEGSGK